MQLHHHDLRGLLALGVLILASGGRAALASQLLAALAHADNAWRSHRHLLFTCFRQRGTVLPFFEKNHMICVDFETRCSGHVQTYPDMSGYLDMSGHVWTCLDMSGYVQTQVCQHLLEEVLTCVNT